jgi:ABC-type transport system substrate-binding protein
MSKQDFPQGPYPAQESRDRTWLWVLGCCLEALVLICIVGLGVRGFLWLRDEDNPELAVSLTSSPTSNPSPSTRPTRTPTPASTATPTTSATMPSATQANISTPTPYPTIFSQTQYNSFRIPHPILADGRVRQAIAFCTNRDALITALYPGLDVPSLLHVHTMFHASHRASALEDGITEYNYDPLSGQQLLEQAGWTLKSGDAYRRNAQGDLLELELKTTTADFRQIWAEEWERQLADCGILLNRNHVASTELFGENSGLAVRDFEMAAYSWLFTLDVSTYGVDLYSCNRIPHPETDWYGQNYMGWCNESASQAVMQAAHLLNFDQAYDLYRTLQVEFTRDLPSLPLFARLFAEAADTQLENFISDPLDYFTWNAYQWSLPDSDMIGIGLVYEPVSLFTMVDNSDETAALTYLYKEPLMGHTSGTIWPNLISEIPSEENGLIQRNRVEVSAGDRVYTLDNYGYATSLETGMTVWGANGEEIVYNGGRVALNQISVTYPVIESLIWSDGQPLSAKDLELGYQVACDEEIDNRFYICDSIQEVTFNGSMAYTVHYIPGFIEPSALEPPFDIYPAHQTTSDGRRLANIPPVDWQNLPEINQTPLGYGPYVPVEWNAGESIIFEANPYYFRGQPAEKRVVVRFYDDSLTALLEMVSGGAVDILPDTAILTSDTELMGILFESMYAGEIQLQLLPSALWEHVDFGLFLP